jgi:DNA-binding CsgD family transcriptional regulator/tetratricopeptide (TPR) repeat protein
VDRLLERDGELAVLDGLARDVVGGGGRALLIGGVAGAGKSSLVRALRGRGDEVAIVTGVCESLSVPIPLAPIRELIERSGADAGADLDELDRLSLVRSLLRAVGREGAALIVVEDAHWADPATVDVIRLLTRHVEGTTIGLVVTFRSDELAASPAMAMLVGDLVSNPSVERLELRPLTAAAVAELARPAGLDVDELMRLTGGNPLLVVESVAAGGGMPATVRDATLARAARLGGEARGALDVAAVIGQRVPVDLLELVAPGASAAVEECLARGALSDGGDALEFRHELVRQAIEDAISPPRRAALHTRVLEGLETLSQHGEPARLAHHAARAGMAEAACRYSAEAGAGAERAGAQRDAMRQFARALRFADGLVPAARADLLMDYGNAAGLADSPAEAVDAQRQALAIAVELGDVPRQARALHLLGFAYWGQSRWPEAERALFDALALLERHGDADARARALAGLARLRSVGLDPRGALVMGARALEAIPEVGADDVRVDAMASLGLAHGQLGDPEGAPLLAAALSAALDGGMHLQVIRGYVNGVWIAAFNRDHATVDELAPRALAHFDAYQVRFPRDDVCTSVARNLLDRGRLAEAVRWAEDGRRTAHPDLSLAAAVQRLARARGGASPQSLPTDLPEPSESASVAIGAICHAALAECAWLAGDIEAARGHARTGLDHPRVDQVMRAAGDLSLWAYRCGDDPRLPLERLPAPVRMELEGDRRGAVAAWRALDAPYEAAMAELRSGDGDARRAVDLLRSIAAEGAVRAFVRERASIGGRAPRGSRRSTRASPAGLTVREREILALIADGHTNPQIAGLTRLSQRTVAHHVSAVLRKLDAPTRTAAAARARSLGLLAEDGTSASQR